MMLLTISIKLLATAEDKSRLLSTMHQFNAACDYISSWCFNKGIYSKFKIQQHIYYHIRQQFNLPAQLAIRAIARVAESYKIDKKIKHTFNKTSSVEYDQRLLSWKALSSVSILSLKGRLSVPIAFGSYAQLPQRAFRHSAKLIYKNKHFYLQALVEVQEEPILTVQGFLGVDFGIVNLVATSDGYIYSGSETERVMRRYSTLKRTLQSVGTRNAKRHLKKISGKERRFKRQTNHILAKRIVERAKGTLKAIALENLRGFRKTVRKAQRERFSKWTFGELRRYIEYKAQLSGIPVMKVDPRNTSRICSSCGYCHKSNRKSQPYFKCKECMFELHADLNAAINIAARASVNRLIAANDYSLSSKPTSLLVGI